MRIIREREIGCSCDLRTALQIPVQNNHPVCTVLRAQQHLIGSCDHLLADQSDGNQLLPGRLGKCALHIFRQIDWRLYRAQRPASHNRAAGVIAGLS